MTAELRWDKVKRSARIEMQIDYAFTLIDSEMNLKWFGVEFELEDDEC